MMETEFSLGATRTATLTEDSGMENLTLERRGFATLREKKLESWNVRTL